MFQHFDWNMFTNWLTIISWLFIFIENRICISSTRFRNVDNICVMISFYFRYFASQKIKLITETAIQVQIFRFYGFASQSMANLFFRFCEKKTKNKPRIIKTHTRFRLLHSQIVRWVLAKMPNPKETVNQNWLSSFNALMTMLLTVRSHWMCREKNWLKIINLLKCIYRENDSAFSCHCFWEQTSKWFVKRQSSISSRTCSACKRRANTRCDSEDIRCERLNVLVLDMLALSRQMYWDRESEFCERERFWEREKKILRERELNLHESHSPIPMQPRRKWNHMARERQSNRNEWWANECRMIEWFDNTRTPRVRCLETIQNTTNQRALVLVRV